MLKPDRAITRPSAAYHIYLHNRHGIHSPRANVGPLEKLLGRDTLLPLLDELVGIEVDAERVLLELGREHVRGGLFGGVEAIDLRLEVVAVGIAVVDGECGAVVDGPQRLDVVRLALRVRLQQVVDGLVCEADVL